MNKALVLQAVVEALRAEFEGLRGSSQTARATGNDPHSKAEGKYDTRSTEENYLADGLAKQAQAAGEAADICARLPLRDFSRSTPIGLSALVQLEFPDETAWFFLAPAGGGLEVRCQGVSITVLTPESPLGAELSGLTHGGQTRIPKAVIRGVE